MKRLTITPAQLPIEIERLHRVPREIWRESGFHTPESYSNFRWGLDPALNDWFTLADVKVWICEEDGVAVGMVVASIADAAEGEKELHGYFGFLEFTDNREVFLTLISTAKEWLWGRGATRVTGPISLPAFMGYGVMVRGHATAASYGTKWRPEWYLEKFHDAGLKPIDHSFGWGLRLKKRNSNKSKSWQPPVEGLAVRRSTPDTIVQDYREVERLAHAQDQENGRLFSPYEFSKFKCDGYKLGMHIAEDGVWVVTAGSQIVGGLLVQADINPTIKSMSGKMIPFGWLYWILRARRPIKYRVSMVTLTSELREVETLRSLLSHVVRELTLAGAVELEFSQIYKNDREMIAALRGIDATESKEWVLFEA